MKTIALSLGAAVAVLAMQPSVAQSNLKIGFVNIQYLLANSPATQAVNDKLRDEFAPRQAELVAKQQELQKKADGYQRDAAVMGEAERIALERELSQADRDLQRRADELQEDANLRQQELVNELQNELARQIQTYAVAQGYDLVVTNAVYASETIDITPELFESMKSGSAPAAKP